MICRHLIEAKVSFWTHSVCCQKNSWRKKILWPTCTRTGSLEQSTGACRHPAQKGNYRRYQVRQQCWNIFFLTIFRYFSDLSDLRQFCSTCYKYNYHWKAGIIISKVYHGNIMGISWKLPKRPVKREKKIAFMWNKAFMQYFAIWNLLYFTCFFPRQIWVLKISRPTKLLFFQLWLWLWLWLWGTKALPLYSCRAGVLDSSEQVFQAHLDICLVNIPEKPIIPHHIPEVQDAHCCPSNLLKDRAYTRPSSWVKFRC